MTTGAPASKRKRVRGETQTQHLERKAQNLPASRKRVRKSQSSDAQGNTDADEDAKASLLRLMNFCYGFVGVAVS
ncbi:hypothetical protein PC111_g10727 [Phytophthora cactorum]|nr:hypothetical protein PC111_g10727 [Phytophthora cactorum]KAG2824248.1 hypothetical protein PC112_g10187 [Phytophthora cactorum]